MQQNTTGVITLPCSQPSNVNAYLRMKSDGTYGLALCGATDADAGVLSQDFIASGLGSSKYASLCVPNFPGPVKMVAAGAISQFATVYGAASGRVGTSSNSNPVGYALDAAAAAGDIIRVVRVAAPTFSASAGTVTAHTADATLAAGALSSVHSNAGAAGNIVLTLPASTAGMEVTFSVDAAHKLSIEPNGTETISAPTTGVPGAAGKGISNSTTGCNIKLFCAVAGNWHVSSPIGTWTVDT